MADNPDQGGEKVEEKTTKDRHLTEQKRLVEQQARLPRIQRNRDVHSQMRERELKHLQLRIEQEKKPSFDHLEHTDKSRKHIAYVFVWGYIIIVGLILIGIPLYNWLALDKPNELELEKTLAQVGALIGSPLGFVVGYYFKEDSRR
jgi:hypothetical protein